MVSPAVLSQNHKLFLAVDCGGSKTAASISDSTGALLGRGIGGPSNWTDVDQSTFIRNVSLAIQLALKHSGIRKKHLEQRLREQQEGEEVAGGAGPSLSRNLSITSTSSVESVQSSSSNPSISTNHKLIPLPPPMEIFEAAWFGIAGVDSAIDVCQVSPLLANLINLPYPSARLIVANDTSLLASPIHDRSATPVVNSGVVVIAGTGSIVVSFRKGSKTGLLKTVGRVGGFGWLLGDEGSGYSVGRNALRAVLDQADRERLVNEQDEFDQTDDNDDYDEEEGGASLADRSNIDGDSSQGSESSPTSEQKRYGHLLRDRILQQWGLLSADDLLNAVYSPHAPTSRSNYTKVDSTTSDRDSSSIPPLLQQDAPHPDHLPVEATSISSSSSSTSSRPFTSSASTSATSTSISTLPASTEPQSRSCSSSPSAETHTIPPPFNKTKHEQDPSSSLLPPIAHAFFGNHRPPPPPSSPIPALESGCVSREVTPEPSDSEDETGDRASVTGVAEADQNGMGKSLTRLQQNVNVGSIESTYESDPERRHSQAPLTITTPTPVVLAPSNNSRQRQQATSLSDPQQHQQQTKTSSDQIGERKHRLASLAPLVFHLAFTHNDALALTVLETQIKYIGDQVIELVRPSYRSSVSAKYQRSFLNPESAVLCLGGSLLGESRYRACLDVYLRSKGVRFARMEFVGDASRSGAAALADMWRSRRSG